MRFYRLASFVFGAAVAGLFAFAVPAHAQSTESPLPFSFDDNVLAAEPLAALIPPDQNHVIGTVDAFWPYHISVRDAAGNMQTVVLHDGTVITPLNWTPMSGDRVLLNGTGSPGNFSVDRVDVLY